MYTEKLYLDHLPPTLLDHYLAKGWYRMGQSMFTCRFLMFQGRLYPAVWIRLPLAQYAFGKRLRKIYGRNINRFRVVTQPGKINMEKERLYQLYRKSFPGRLAPSLKISLLDDGHANLFNTYETCIYDGADLVGFSFFDLGKGSVASILGVYHPDYKKHSLGFFTMLLEISFARENGFTHYYPGYIVPGYPKFDYKARIGPVECFLEKKQQWVPIAGYPFNDLPTERMEINLREVKRHLDDWGMPSQLALYPPYEANLIGYWILDYLEYPMLLECGAPDGLDRNKTIVVFDATRDIFRLLSCSVYDDLTDFFHASLSENPSSFSLQLELLIKEELVTETNAALDMAHAAARFLSQS
jgi:leucyl-tRNA---protein transferase